MITMARASGSNMVEFYNENGTYQCRISVSGGLGGTPTVNGDTIYVPRADGRTEIYKIYGDRVSYSRTI